MSPTALRWGPLLLLALAGVLAYHETLSVPFVFDDHRWIVDNPSIRSLADPAAILGSSNRPVLQLSFAFDYAIGGLEPAGYHAVNIAIHVLAGLTLFGVIRRSGLTLRKSAPDASNRSDSLDATTTAFAVALLWLLHPLQTQAVTYTVQRGESLTSLLFLLTLYCGIRAADVSASVLRNAWTAAGIAACAIGMATKPVMVTAPLVVVLYDWTFRAGSLREILARRPVWYAGLFATWGVLALSVRDVSGGLGEAPPSPLAYALTQPEVLLHYLRLVVWPWPQCFDYAWPLAESPARIAPAALAIAAWVGVSLWGLVRRKPWGFLSSSCLLMLAPTSTILPLVDAAFEHRMYLPLAPLLVLAVLGLEGALARVEASGRAALAVSIAIALGLGVATLHRNRVYQSPIALWQSVVAVSPKNARAHHNLGLRLLEDDRPDEAVTQLRTSLRLAPNWADPMASIGYWHAERGELEQAREWYARSVAADPRVAAARVSYGLLLMRLKKPGEAAVQYRAALALEPGRGEVQGALGLALQQMGQPARALVAYDAARELGFESADVDIARADLLLREGRRREGLEALRDGLRREPDSIPLANNLAWHLATLPDPSLRDPVEAVRWAERAATESDRRDANVLDTLAVALAAAGRGEEAMGVLDEAIALARASGNRAMVRSLEAKRPKLMRDAASSAGKGALAR